MLADSPARWRNLRQCDASRPSGPVANRPGRLGSPPRQRRAGGRLAGHLRKLASGGPGRSPQVNEGLPAIQPFPFHERAPGLVDQAPSVQGDLELLGQAAAGMTPHGGPEQGRHQPGIGLQGADLGRIPATRGGGVHIQGADRATAQFYRDAQPDRICSSATPG